MATYNELFPHGDPALLAPLDPIKPRALGAQMGGAVRRSALGQVDATGDAVDAAEDPLAKLQRDISALMGPSTPRAPDGETKWGDSLKNLASGAVETGAMATGALEYGSRQLLGDENNSFVTDRLAAGRRGLTNVIAGIDATMSPEAQDRLARQWDTLDPGKTIWQGGAGEFLSAVGYKLGRSIPSTLATLLPAARLFKAGMSPGAIAYLGASEGGLSMGGIANGIAQEIEGMTEEELQQESPRYQQMLRDGDPPGVARQRLIGEAQGAAPLIGGATVGAISAVAGRYLEPVFVKEGGMGLAQRFGRGFAAESPQEAAQGSAEQLAQNIAAQIYDSDRPLSEGVPNAAIEGGAIGGLMGGGFSAALGQRPQRRALPEPPPAAETEQFVDPAVAAAIKNSDLASQEEADLARQPTMGYGQGEMFGPPPGQADFADTSQPAPQYPFGGTDPAGFAVQQDQFQFSYPPEAPKPSTAVAAPPEGIQPPLGLRETQRARGVGRGVITPTPAMGPGPMADQSAPPEFSNERVLPDRAARLPLTRADVLRQEQANRYAGTVRDENQLDMFAPPDPAAGPAPQAQRQTLGFRVTGRGPDGAVRYEQDADTREEAQAIVDSFSLNEKGELTSDDTMWSVEPVSTLVGGKQGADQPTAEPLGDLLAQQQDLADPDSPRLGLYLSRDNVAQLRQQGVLDRVRSQGIPLMNFDLRGGTLIAKNRQVADELLAMRKQGRNMQEILGLATGAGTGKPADGQIVVQQRDENGNVTRETLVRSEQEAEALAAQWEQEDPTRDTVFLDPRAAIGRRATKVAKETKQLGAEREKRAAARIVGDTVLTLPEEVQEGVLTHALTGSTRAEAADLMAEAAQVANRTQKRKGSHGFESPDNISFRTRKGTPEQDKAVNEKYRRLFDRYETLIDTEIELGMEISDRRDAAKFKPKKRPLGQQDRVAEAVAEAQTAKRKTVADTLKRMRKIARERADIERSLKTYKQAYEYETTATKIAKAAEKVDASAVRRRAAVANLTTPDSTPDTAIGDLKPMTNEEIDALSEGRLDEAFMQAANFMSGLHVARDRDKTVKVTQAESGSPSEIRIESLGRLKPSPVAASEGATNEFTPSGVSIDEYVAGNPTPSEKRKFVKRAQIQLRKQDAGRRGKLEKVRLGRSRVNINSLIIGQETRAETEMSKEQREANRKEAAAAFKELGRTVRSIEMALARIQGIEAGDVENIAAGRAHLRNLYQLAIGLLRSGDRSVPATKAAQKFTKAIDAIIGSKDPKNLARRLTELGRREFTMGKIPQGKPRTFSAAFRAFVRGDMKDLGTFFRAMTRAQLNEVMARPGKAFLRADQRERLAKFERAADKWFANARQYYMDYISPVLVNMRQPAPPTIARFGTMGEERLSEVSPPTPQDIKRVRTALLWIGKSPQFSAMVVDPIVAQLKDVGFTFNEKGVLTGWEPRNTPRETSGAAPQLDEEKTKVQRLPPSKGPLPQGVFRSPEEQAQARENERLAALQPMIDKYDRAVTTLLREIDEAAVAGQIAAAEEKFYASIRKLGVWGSDGISSLMPAGARSYNKRVGPRLSRKELTMAQAKRELRDTFMEIGQKRDGAEKVVEETQTPTKNAPKQTINYTPAARAFLPFDSNEVGATAAIKRAFQHDRPRVVDVLQALRRTLPRDHGWRQLADALSRVPGIQKLRWNLVDDLSVPGAFAPASADGEARLLLNSNALDGLTSSELLHVLLHETVHAATVAELVSNPQLARRWEALRAEVAKAANGKFELPDVFEFVSEAYSNREFQEFLKGKSLWQRVLDFARRLFGMPPSANTFLDQVMSLRDETFSGRVLDQQGHQKYLQYVNSSQETVPYTGIEVADDLIDRFRSAKAWRDGSYDLAKRSQEKAGTGALAALTMSQIRDFYYQMFPDGSLTRYYEAFSRRNADNSKNMEEVDAYSREWTKLIEAHGGEQAANFSRLMTQATVHAVHPDLPLTHKDNAHLTSKEQREWHAKLSKLYQSLPAWQKHYKAVKTYYREAHEKQQALAVLNALRAYLTTGKKAPMETAAFDAKYTEDNVLAKKLNTKKGLKAEFGDTLDKTAIASISQLGALRTMSEGPYFPLKRFGKYTTYAEKLRETKHFGNTKDLAAYREELRAQDPTLQFKRGEDNLSLEVWDVEFRMAETPSQARDDYNELVGLYGRDAVKKVNLRREEFNKAPAISGTRGLKSILDKLEGNAAAQAAIKNFYLASLADASFRKHERQRQNTRGFRETDQHRTFATYSKAAAYYMSQLRYGWKLADARAEIGKAAETIGLRAGQVAKEIQLRDQMTTDPEEMNPIVQKASEVSQFMLLSSVSYWLVNASQPWLVTQPYLGAKYGQAETAKALARAQGLIADPLLDQAKSSWAGLKALKTKGGKTAAEDAFTVINQVRETLSSKLGTKAKPYLDMLTDLQRRSIIDLSFVAELRQIADGKNVNTRWQRALDATRIMAHLTEVNNRVMTAIAAYDLAIGKGLSHEDAVAQAEQAVEHTQFNYSGANAPRIFQSDLGRIAFQFMKYPQHMYALMARQIMRTFSNSPAERTEALKVLGGVVATHFAVGGLLGVTLQPLKIVAAMIMAGLDDEDDRGKDVISGAKFDRKIREWASAVLGDDLGRAVSKGPVGALIGTDLSSRMSLGTLYFMDMNPESAETLMGSLAMTFGGPSVNLLGNAYNASQYLREGDIYKAIETTSPKFLKDLMRANRFSDEGITGRDGTTYLSPDKLDARDIALQTIGFGTMKASESFERGETIRAKQEVDKSRRTRLIRSVVNAESDADRATAMEAIREFSKTSKTPITRSDILKAMRRRADRNMRIDTFGADLRGRNILYAEEGEPYDYGEAD